MSATLCAQPSSSLTARAVLALTDLTEKVLGKERSRTTVAIHYVPEQQWARGGAMPARGFYVEVKVTTSTNSRDDKA
ncbi:MAG TPA: tautomerase family protein, partial [Burkholderiales bacterium]|nr:tautomerase family protein [Burkholderiales bacterium]